MSDLTNINKELQDIILKNLPAHISETLQKQLALIPELKKSKEEYGKMCNDLRQQVKDYEKLKLDASNIEAQKQQLSVEQQKLKDAERQLKIEKLEFQLLTEKEKTDFVKDVALNLTRNTLYRKSVYNNEHISGHTRDGSYVGDHSVTHNHNETTTTE